jgi:hypothetical protein
MTFTEAALEVLRREGKPLHFSKIAEIAIRENLLDHVGKIPDEIMAGQLAAHCKLPHGERRMLPVQQGTFALVEWGLDEDAAGLDRLIEPPPEGELPYRGRERHPIPSRELARSTGRGEGRARRREEGEERRGKRYPPPAEVAYEILAGAGRPLTLAEIAGEGAERLLMPDAFVRDAGSLGAALREDNRRREGAGRQALFAVDGDVVTLAAQPEPGERAAAPLAPLAARAPATAAELRKAGLAAIRRRLRACDPPTVEHVAARLLERLGYRDLKVAKRGREHVIYTARRRMGLADVRHGIRIVRSGADAGRREVVDLRRDLGHYGAQIGVLVTAGEAGREARGEAVAAGQLPILLLCGEAFAEALADAGVGAATVAVPEVDDAFFRAAADAAGAEEAARRARREERERRDGGDRERREPRREPAERREVEIAPGEVPSGEVALEAGAQAPEGSGPRVITIVDMGGEGDADDGDDEGGEAEEGEGAAAAEAPAEGAQPGRAEGGRRRRRRRRRGGRGRSREGGPTASAAAPASEPGAGAPEPAAAAAPPPEPPRDPPSAGDGSGPRSDG